MKIFVQQEAFDLGLELAALKENQPGAGALVSFTGTVRDQLGSLKSLTLEHYPGMTEKELTRIAESAVSRFDLIDITLIHRYGPLQVGEDIVLVAALSPHRDAAFDGARYVMDFLKTKAPFWKKEDTGTRSDWVDARETDTAALKRWQTQ